MRLWLGLVTRGCGYTAMAHGASCTRRRVLRWPLVVSTEAVQRLVIGDSWFAIWEPRALHLDLHAMPLCKTRDRRHVTRQSAACSGLYVVRRGRNYRQSRCLIRN